MKFPREIAYKAVPEKHRGEARLAIVGTKALDAHFH